MLQPFRATGCASAERVAAAPAGAMIDRARLARQRVLTEHEPVTLYPTFGRNNFADLVETGSDSVYALTLWLKG